MRLTGILLLLCGLAAAAAWAQETPPDPRETVEKQVTKELPVVNDILKVIGLPELAEEAREAGVPEDDIRVILEEAERRDLPPAETEVILEGSRDAARENGPVDNFGAFVQSQLDQGLRGQDLAAAIHAEHKLRGKGKGHGKEKGHDKDKGRGKGKGKKNKDKPLTDDDSGVQPEDGGARGEDGGRADPEDRDEPESKDRGDGERKSRTKPQKGGGK